jgi:stage IV sporulation protein FB
MDGGRVLRALLATKLGFVRATEIAAAIGQGTAFLLGFIGLLYNPLLIFIAIFVYLAASSEAHMVALRAVSRGVPVSAATMTRIASLSPDAHIDEAVQTLLATSQNEFPVVDGAGKPIGLLGRSDIIRALKTLGPDARVHQAMNGSLPTIDKRRRLEDALQLLQDKSTPAVAVVESDGRLLGLITPETLGELMMVREAMPAGMNAGPWSRPAGA